MLNLIVRAWLLCLTLFAGLILVSCTESTKNNRVTDNIKMTDDTLVNYNLRIVETESQAIDDFIGRYHWKMTTSQTGLRYMIIKTGEGPKPGQGQVAVLRYDLKLLTGESVYSSAATGPMEFVIGTGSVVNGLEEGVLMLRQGGSAKLIVPSHLAFGLLGDMKKIPEK